LGGGKYLKKKIACGVGMSLGHGCVGLGVVEVAVKIDAGDASLLMGSIN
jgi:hypothetical protein